MCTTITTLPLIQKLTMIIYGAGLLIVTVGIFRMILSNERKLYLLWAIPLFFQFLGMSLQIACPETSVTSSIWKLALVCSVLCILFSAWIFIHVMNTDKRAKDLPSQMNIILPGVFLQVALLVSSLVYGS